MVTRWLPITSQKEYKKATARYEELPEESIHPEIHNEKALLAHLISDYEKKKWIDTPVDPIEVIKIRMKDMGLKPADLAKEYGDKGTISKVLSYRQALSLTMIRKFSELLRVPAQLLIKEYPLRK